MIGSMDKRITIEARSITRVKGVKTDNGWVALDTVYGSLVPLNGYERRIAEQNGLVASHRVWMRYRDNLPGELLPEHELVIDSIRYEIRSVINHDLRGKYYEVLVENRL